MKRFIIMMLAVLLAAPVAEVSAQKLSRAIKKEYKAKLKQLKAEKWELYGSARSIESTLTNYYLTLDTKDNVREIMGFAPRFKSKTVGHQTAINDACRNYAQQLGSTVKGRVDSDLASDGIDVSSEFDHFYAAFERTVEKEIQGEIQEKFSIIRQIDKEKGVPIYEMQTYFIVDEEAAYQARIRAYEQALKESEAAQKVAGKIGDFVKAGFE